MMLDILTWLVVRTDLTGAVLSMIVKDSISILGAISEWFTKEATRGNGSRKNYKERTQKLVVLKRIPPDLKAELDWVWDIRCNAHIYQVTSLEHEMYSRKDYNRALKAYTRLRDLLVEHYGSVRI